MNMLLLSHSVYTAHLSTVNISNIMRMQRERQPIATTQVTTGRTGGRHAEGR
jgi:hypothetical protein